jgi:glycosyltransferase involved in cell wall biosynthesis
MTKLDIVVPCYNYGRFLNACVTSILEQSVQDLRILIIDDASRDDSAAVAKTLARSDPRVTAAIHPHNRGHIATYNEGIDWASAEYFLLISADDLLVPGAIERSVKIMDDNPDIVLTHGKDLLWYDNQPPPPFIEQSGWTWKRHNLIREICTTGANHVATPTAIVRTSTQKVIGGYREQLPHAGDMEMWLRFAANGSVAKIDAIQAIYRKHANAMSAEYFATLALDYEQRRKAFDNFFDEYGDRVTNSAALQSSAVRAMNYHAIRCIMGLFRRGNLRDGYRLFKSVLRRET